MRLAKAGCALLALAMAVFLLFFFFVWRATPRFTVMQARVPAWQVTFRGWTLPLRRAESVTVRQLGDRLMIRAGWSPDSGIGTYFTKECFAVEARPPASGSIIAAGPCTESDWNAGSVLSAHASGGLLYPEPFGPGGVREAIVAKSPNGKWKWVFSLQSHEIKFRIPFSIFPLLGNEPSPLSGLSVFQVLRIEPEEELLRFQSRPWDDYPALSKVHWVSDRWLLIQFEPEFGRAFVVNLPDK